MEEEKEEDEAAKAEESKEPDEQRQKILVFDAEIPVFPLVEKRGELAEKMRGKETEKARGEVSRYIRRGNSLTRRGRVE